MADDKILQTETDHRGIMTLTLNRPDKHNALSEALIDALMQSMHTFSEDKALKLLVLKSAGKSFCAGADILHMHALISQSQIEQQHYFCCIANLLQALAGLTKPVVAVVQGNVFGGGLGLAACTDIVLAEETTRFCLSEVKLGLIPAVIYPYLVRKMGPSFSDYYSLSAKEFNAAEAKSIGLVHTIAKDRELINASDALIKHLLTLSANAMHKYKTLTHHINQPIDKTLIDYTIEHSVALMHSTLTQKRLNDFFNQRPKKTE